MTATADVYFNGKFYSGGLNGVHRVADRLIRECDAILADLPLARRPRVVLMTSAKANWVPDLRVIERVDSPSTGQVWEQIILPVRTRGGVLVNLANLAPVAHRSKITMIHDTQFLFKDTGMSARQRLGYRCLAPLIGQSSHALLTVSEYSRRMLSTFNIAPDERIYVVPNGADHFVGVAENPRLVAKLGLEPGHYAVTFGSTKAYKNTATLFAAFRDPALAEIKLVVIGCNREELKGAGLSPPGNVVFAGKAPDDEVRGLLAGAIALLFPSRTEGFGLPPLEAMVCGCPVVASPAGAIPEACGSAVLYAGTERPDEWRDAVLSLRDDRDLRARKIAEGHSRVREFTWRRAALSVMEAIEEALARSPRTRRGVQAPSVMCRA